MRDRARQAEQRLAAGAEWSGDNDFVFPNMIGKPQEPRAIDAIFKRLLKRAGLPATVRFHDLRHSCATLLIERGADLYEVSRLLGHSSITITANIYGHFSEAMKRGLVDKMDAVLVTQTAAVDARAAQPNLSNCSGWIFNLSTEFLFRCGHLNPIVQVEQVAQCRYGTLVSRAVARRR